MRSAAQIAGNVIIGVVFLVLGGVALELAARIAEAPRSADRDAPRPAPSKERVENIVRNLVVAFDQKYNYDELIRIFPLMQDQLRYRPWIQIGNADHSNPFSVVENGIRKSVAGCEGTDKKPKVVWFFGGSTTYGVGVPWWDTIPSKFVEEAKQSGVCVTAINYGVPYHFSRQEAVYFATRLMNEPAPDAVVFLDGLNEFFQPGSSIRAEPFFTPTLDKLVPIGPDPSRNASLDAPAPGLWTRAASFFRNLHLLKRLGLSQGAETNAPPEESYSNRNPPPSKELSNDEVVARAIVDRYVSTRDFVSKTCKAYGVRCFQFLQPIAAVDYQPPASEVVTEDARKRPEPAGRFVAGYSLMREVFRSGGDAPCGGTEKGLTSLDLSSLFKNYEGIPYVDYGHYAPRANKLIATEMFRCVFAKP
jgi:hypothetical protein